MISDRSIAKVKKYLPPTIYYIQKITKITAKKIVNKYCPIWVRNYF